MKDEKNKTIVRGNKDMIETEAQIKWLIIIAQTKFETDYPKIKLKPSFREQNGDVIVLEYFATTQEIDKLSRELRTSLTMCLPSQKSVLFLIDNEGILWRKSK